jgi:7-cyano-7-deazaguanine synthase
MIASSAVCLLSGGQDSTTTLFWAIKNFTTVHAISFRYGQRHEAEIEAAVQIAERAGVTHDVFDLGILSSISDSDLLRRDIPIKPTGGTVDTHAAHGLPTSFVPGRNLLFLSVAGAIAASLRTKHIVAGVCQTDFAGYPDCRRTFVDSLEVTLNEAMASESGPFNIHTPLMDMSKAETVDFAESLGPVCWDALAVSMTCYEGSHPPCGKCLSCTARIKGFADAKKDDPLNSAPLVDLDAIKHRKSRRNPDVNEWTRKRFPKTATDTATDRDIDSLISEVERLRILVNN